MRLALPALALSVAALVGCTTSVSASAEPVDAEATTAATAVIVVEGTSANEGDRADTVARFIRARAGAVDEDALRMVGAVVDFPALGACAAISNRALASTGTSIGGSSGALSLVDVGGVSLVAGDTVVALAPRQLPDVADLVSGVVYSTRVDTLPSRGAVALRVDGSPDLAIPSFAVPAVSPGAPENVRVAGEDGRAGAVALTTSAPVEISWTAPDESVDDVVYVDVSSATSAPSARCLFADSGRAKLPATIFGAIEDGSIAVHRLHRESFHAKGVDPGEVRFDFARVVPFVRR